MPKHERALSYFPSFYDATTPGSLLYHVARVLAAPLEQADTLLYRIQRAHRVRVAEDLNDLVLLGGALNLSARHFDDILAPKQPTDYAERVGAARRRIERLARLHLGGLGTPWAVMEGAAIFLDAETIPPSPGAGPVHHEDEDGFSHWIDVSFTRAPSAPRSRVTLHENPLRRRKAEPADMYPLNRWTLRSENVEASQTRIVIRGVGDRTVMPSVFCAATGGGVSFYGVVPDGATLIIDAVTGATLEGKPVDDFVSYDSGGWFDEAAQFDPPSGATGRFMIEHDGPRAPFDGDLARLFTLPRQRHERTPDIPVGPSDWGFTVAVGVYDRSDAEFAVFAPPTQPIGTYGGDLGFEAVVFDYPASANVGVGWNERIPCAFKLLVPPRVPQPGVAGDTLEWASTDVARMSAMVDRFRPAGVRAFVDVAKDDWILGESPLRSATATSGAGLEFDAANVRPPGADRFIPLDPSTLNT